MVETVEELFDRIKEEFNMQLFKKTVRKSEYKRHSLIKEFKRELNRVIRRRLAKIKISLVITQRF